MAREIPSAPKVHTTNYQNFKGVDFTNDPTNVWYRRSPDGVNMLPDDAGRPFKRTGWEVAVNAGTLASQLTGVDELRILKCHYFELAGIDHILIFTDGGVFRYADIDGDGEPEVDILDSSTSATWSDSKDIDCYTSYDRAFFFEGDGVGAFYIYGNYKVWIYGYENEDFSFKLAEDGFDVGNLKIPRVIIEADPSTCSGTTYENYNLIGGKCAIEYPNNNMFYHYTTSTAFTYSLTKTDFDTAQSISVFPNATYILTYDNANTRWDVEKIVVASGSETVTTSTSSDIATDYGITLYGTPENDDKIVVIYMYGTLLPNNVAQDQIDDVSAFVTTVTQYDTELERHKEYTTSTPPTRYRPDDGEFVLHTDTESLDKKAWIEYPSSISDTDDQIRVIIPVSAVTVVPYSEQTPSDSSIVINGKGA